MSSDQRDLETKIQVGIGFVVVLVIFFVISWLGNKTPTEIKNQKEDVIAQQKIEAPTSEPRYSSSTKMGRVKEILKPYPDSFYAYPGDPSFKAPPDDYNGPIDIVIIDTTASTCDAAKTLAYDLYKSIFSDALSALSMYRTHTESIFIKSSNYIFLIIKNLK